LGEGNAKANKLVSIFQGRVPVDRYLQARSSHANFHQGARALRKQFDLTQDDAKGIVKACPQCNQIGPGLGLGVNPRGGLGLGVNPRGLQALELWQMDVTHVAEFGRLKYVHVSIDTFSKMIWATAL
ncbi:POK10 protein, partial [Brachypteracias leptosomus]|nr:POK10 protein [Brachypteracias leptosomus]